MLVEATWSLLYTAPQPTLGANLPEVSSTLSKALRTFCRPTTRPSPGNEPSPSSG